MRLAYHVAKLAYDSLCLAFATRKISLVLVILLGLLLMSLAFTAQVVAPLAMYPFA